MDMKAGKDAKTLVEALDHGHIHRTLVLVEPL